ncbi:MAG: M28 family peptidase [bacterium]
MKNRNLIIVLCVAVLSLVLSAFVLYTPVVSAASEGFSAVQAAAHIAEISRAPHSVLETEAAAHEDVRAYIKEQLEAYVGAANVVETTYAAADVASDVGEDVAYDVTNLLAVIPGDSPVGILLVAHYDSRGHIGRAGELGRSYGAADDGYGISVLLEIARLYGDRDLTNTIYILATDAEETGLYGAHMAAQEAFMANVGFVINLEARGVDGPAYMFETSLNNVEVLHFYRNAELPVSYSIATAVYSVMPNLTDFTEFLAIGKQGINFAVLKGLFYYHTPNDEYINIDLSSIQHYGAQIVPLVEEFVTDVAYADVHYFEADENAIFFTLFPNVFISYTETAGLILTIVFLLLAIALVVRLTIKKELKPLAILKYIGVILAVLIAWGLIGVLLSKLIAWFGKTTWSLTYVRMNGTEIPVLVILVACLADLFMHVKKSFGKAETVALMLAGIFLNLVLALATGIALSGASFLFFVPAAVGILSLAVRTFVKNRVVEHVALAQNILWNALIAVPLIYSLFLALTVGGLPALLVILIIDASIWLPAVRLQLLAD